MAADNSQIGTESQRPAEHGHESNSANSLAHLHDTVQNEFAQNGNKSLSAPPSTAEHILPPMHVGGAKDNHPTAPQKGGFFAVVGDMAYGAAREIYHHPLEIAKDAAIGVAAGAAAVVAGPEIAAVAGVALAVGAVEAHGGFAKVGSELWQGGKNLIHNGEVVANPEGHTKAEQEKAKEGLEEAGAVGAHVAAGVAGGLAGGIGTSALASAMRSSEKVVTETLIAGTEGGAEAGTVTGGTAGGASTEVAKETGKIIATTGEVTKESALTEGKLTLSSESSSGSTHADVHAGSLTNADGNVHDVYFHGEEMTPEATAARVAKEQAGEKLNRIIGFENSYPESQAVKIEVGGKTRTGWIQEAAGKPLENELRARAAEQFGTTAHLDQDVAKILAQDPALEKQVEQAVVERLVYGDHDIAARNIGVTHGAGAEGQTGATTVRNFDLGEGFSESTTPELHSYQMNLSTIGLQNAFSGKPLSEGVRETLRNFVSNYDNPAGLAALRQTGLNDAQLQGVVGRARWLADHGTMPEVDAKLNDPENISWYRMLEDRRH
ncbi:MAG: hypothetical protein KGS72_12700 [Cyanobacteria bacterium REEB67]|nr:hypothetical protein [Cyanobacteria bacterium REEB67]